MTSQEEFDSRLRVISVIVGLAFLVLLARMWQLQIISGAQYKRQAFENRLRNEKITSPRGIIYDRNGKPLVKNAPYYYVAVQPEMVSLVDVRAVADFLVMDPVELSRMLAAAKNPIDPVKVKGGLTFDQVAFIESRISEYPYLMIDAEQTRYYPNGPVGAHLIGYLGKLNPQQVSRPEHHDVPSGAFVGQWGVEKLFDTQLRGTAGNRIIEVDALGRRLSVYREESPEKGEDIHLSIDLALQQTAEDAFANKVGALVAIRPSTGELLALVSKPSFDPNLFSRGIDYDEWVRLSTGENYPMLNRALQSQYPPGSTFKIATAMAALETKACTPSTTHFCGGALSKGRWRFRCWKRAGHGSVDMHDAIVQSCDVYFYQTGEDTGIDNIAKYARMMGLGAESGLRVVSEKSGLIPDTEWKKRTKGEPWYPGETFNAAIGQGFILTTPAQLAEMAATVANGGRRMHITLLRIDDESALEPEVDLALDPLTIKTLKDALRGVVAENKGTGGYARSKIVDIAGKTGTAQVITQREGDLQKDTPAHLRDHAWFVSFAPVDNPEIAVAVLVEHGGHGGESAAPIARRAIETYMTGLAERAGNAQN